MRARLHKDGSIQLSSPNAIKKHAFFKGGEKKEIPGGNIVSFYSSLKDTSATDATGTAIPEETLKTLLSTQVPVVVSSDGKAIDPSFQGLLKPETIILRVRAWTLVQSAARPKNEQTETGK